ncbi:13699_t:CDS:2 [Entrophospora sp. SA101]|nr:13699_t:CDS:2 [Entrophospora sp. SA101]
MHANNFATLVNTAVSTKEMIHRLYKAIIPHSNKKNIELDFVCCDNCLQTLQFLLDGGVDERYDYISSSTIDLDQEDNSSSPSQITCMNENYINHDLQTADLENTLNDDLFAEIGYAYQEQLNCIEHLASQKVKYFKSISYTIIDDDDWIDVNLHVGDIIDVLEDISNNENTGIKMIISYA